MLRQVLDIVQVLDNVQVLDIVMTMIGKVPFERFYEIHIKLRNVLQNFECKPNRNLRPKILYQFLVIFDTPPS